MKRARTKTDATREYSVTLIMAAMQIIASILLIKARTVRSEETRMHLQDAHHRVMSVAALQQQFQIMEPGETIALGPYLSRLCEVLAGSMIAAKDATWPSARVVATDNFRRVSESYYGISPVDGFSPGAYLGGKPSKSNPSRDCEAVPQTWSRDGQRIEELLFARTASPRPSAFLMLHPECHVAYCR